jgi:gamma-glutamyltranspeptidase/glutathione hydrolase
MPRRYDECVAVSEHIMILLASRRVSRVLFTLAFGLALGAQAQTAPPPELPSGWTDKDIVYRRVDMVAAANPLAVQAGVDTLGAGGTAVDAAIAVQMVLNLVEPQSSGLGGGAFMMTYTPANGAVEMYDGRETAPAAATGGLFLQPNGQPMGFTQAQIGGRSVGVPGLLRMLELAHRDKGRLPWASLFEPAIRLAENGFAISPRLFSALQGANAALRTGPVTGPYFYNADGTPKAVGTILRNPEFAQTLRTIAASGANAFYTGPIAQDIVNTVKSHPTNPGLLELADLAGYQVKKRDPICRMYRGRFEICGTNMPSSGGATVMMTLGILENFDVAALAPNSAQAVHLISEAYRLAYADRNLYMADPDFVCVPVAGLLDPNYLRARSQLISMTRSMGTPVAGTPSGCGRAAEADEGVENGTSHMSIVDRDGNAVSMTTTIESGFGSYQMVRGFLLNNELTDFSFTPTDAGGNPIANRVEPGKRPRSSMAPTIVFDDKDRLYAIVGSPGGSAIIQYVVKTLVGILDWGLDIQTAIELGNFGAQTTPTTQLERGSSVKDLGPALQALGHTVSVVDINSGLHGVVRIGNPDASGGGLGAIVRPLRGWSGGADPRREGTADGH